MPINRGPNIGCCDWETVGCSINADFNYYEDDCITSDALKLLALSVPSLKMVTTVPLPYSWLPISSKTIVAMSQVTTKSQGEIKESS